MLLQDAVASLSPRMTIGNLVAEPIRIHGLDFRRALGAGQGADAAPRALGRHSGKFPHQISGARPGASRSCGR
jgi:peptide/nickel transport system ATP-binding protein